MTACPDGIRIMVRETRGLFATFARDTRGTVILYVTILLPALIGFGLLAVDGGRLFNLQTSLQAAADAFALAGAAELDGRADAIARANNAIDTLVQNRSKFSVAGLANVTVASRRYLRELPANDADPIDNSYLAANAQEAAFVELVVTPATLNTLLPLPSWTISSVTTGARAVAGFSLTICKIMPIFMCNPYEGTGVSIFDVAASGDLRRRQVRLRYLGSNAAYFPGDFAWLSVGCNGAKCLAENLAKTSPDTCYSARGVTTEPGQKQGAMAGINVRFDIYEGMMGESCDPLTGTCTPSPYVSDADYAPASNVRKGFHDSDSDPTTTCDQEDLEYGPEPRPPGRLPRDGCFLNDPFTCPFDRLGDGEWACEDYWNSNYDDTGLPPPAGCSNDPSLLTMTRHDMHEYEKANGLVSHQNSTPETGESSCSLMTPPPGTDDRRLIRGAIINCAAEGPLNGRETDVPVLTWAEFFLTEPVERPGPDGELWLELVRITDPDPNDSGVHDDVQLYR